MHPRIRHGVEPPAPLGIEIGVAHELPAVDEIAPDVAHRALHFPLGLCPVRISAKLSAGFAPS
jgi:hypothetical protein